MELLNITSKLPNQGTTIFTVMSKLASDYNAINLSQGFPDFKVSTELVSLVNRYMQMGMNQYAPMPGEPTLRNNISQKLAKSYQAEFDPDTEITVTAGATEGLYAMITAIVEEGDEVIIFEPAYDCYRPAIELNKGIVVPVKMKQPDFRIDWNEVEDKISSKTKLIIINSPHNPTGATLKKADLDSLSSLIQSTDILVLSDEVYEHIIFDGEEHQSILQYPLLRERGAAVFSFGKTFHATGWKVGYTVAPEWLTREIRKVHQFLTFSVHTPTQWALGEFVNDEHNYKSLPKFYQKKRDLFLALIESSRFQPIHSSGTYFQLLSYQGISDLDDRTMAETMTKDSGVASIPISVFYGDNQDDRILRFCFAKSDMTLEKAAKILCKI